VADHRPDSASKYLADIEANTAGMKKNWDAYEATFLTPDETVLAMSFKEHWAAQQASAIDPWSKPCKPKTSRRQAALPWMWCPRPFCQCAPTSTPW
jgi:hypothetical protein